MGSVTHALHPHVLPRHFFLKCNFFAFFFTFSSTIFILIIFSPFLNYQTTIKLKQIITKKSLNPKPLPSHQHPTEKINKSYRACSQMVKKNLENPLLSYVKNRKFKTLLAILLSSLMNKSSIVKILLKSNVLNILTRILA